jgi:hypothetical protein
VDWDPDFADRSPIFEPLRERAAALRTHCEWPSREALQALISARGVATAGGAPLRLAGDIGTQPYESRIRLAAEMHVRERDWHDFFTVLVWLTYPKTKAALNDAQHAAWLHERASAGAASSQRGPARDALTLFDENGAIVLASDSSLLDDVRAFRWKRLFRDRRSEVRAAMRFFVFGHALLHKALQPYVGITAHAMLLTVSAEVLSTPLPQLIGAVDTLAAPIVHALETPLALSPLPLLGVPGWWPANEHAAFYDDTRYFRAGRAGR